MDVARQGQQLLGRQHGHGLFPRRLCGLFQIQGGLHRDIKDVIAARRPLCHQGFEHRRRLLAQQPGHRRAVGGGVPHRVGAGDVGDLFLVQHPHDVGFFLFLFGHGFTPKPRRQCAVFLCL